MKRYLRKLWTGNGIVAITVWLLGLYTTVLFLEQIGVSPKNGISLFVGVGVQLTLTFSQHKIWQKPKSIGVWVVAVFLVLIDTLLNYGGLSPYLVNIGETSAYASIGLPSSPALIQFVGVAICLLIAALPEMLLSE